MFKMKMLLLPAFILLSLTPASFAQGKQEFIYVSPPTLGQIIRDIRARDKAHPPDKIDLELIPNFLRTINYWNDFAADEGGAGRYRRFFKDWVNPFTDYPLEEFGGPLSGLSKFRDWADERFLEGAARKFRLTRDFEVRETFERTATQIVNEHCGGNIDCSEQVFERLLNDQEVRNQLGEADALGAFDEAQTRAYVKAAIGKATRDYEGAILEINNLELTINAAFEQSNKLIINGFNQVNINQRKIIRNTALIFNIQQQHTLALTQIQASLDANFELIQQNISNVIELQQLNLFLSETIAIGIQQIDAKLVNLSLDIADIRETQINDIFINSPIDQQIKLLLNAESSISQLIIKREGDEYRQQLIANLKAIKIRQDIVATASLVAEWGSVAREALTIFCRDCPEEISTGINLGLQMTDVIGNVAAGNYAKAVLSGLGIFRKPQPGPELKMLQRISLELKSLERNMNAQFKGVHEHLFALEENLGRRLDIIDLKLDQLAREVLISRVQIMEGLSGIDAKLNYIVNQNDCIKDVVLVLTNQQNQDMCKIPASEFRKSIAANRIGSFQDLNNFFRGGSCSNCIRTLFDVSNVSLSDAAFFRYTQCNPENPDNKARADRVYEFIFNNLFAEQRNEPASVTSLLFLPQSITVVDSIRQQVATQEDLRPVALTEEDRFYRNYQQVIAFADYVLSMFSFMELYDNGRLLTPAELLQNPGFTKERARKMVIVLEDLLAVLNHTIIQQSLMTGNGTFRSIDRLLAQANNVRVKAEAGAFYTLSDLFTYNPYIRKNYSAYLLDKVIGFERLAELLKNGSLDRSPQRLIFQGYSILLTRNSQSDLRFKVSLTNSVEPSENIELFQASLPLVNGALDEEAYSESLKFAFPSSIVELESVRKFVTEKLAEMKLITSPELDDPDSDFTREDLLTLIQEFELDQAVQLTRSN